MLHNQANTWVQLLTREVDKRLGSGPEGGKAVKNHPFFKDIDFDKLERREIEAPFRPKVKNEYDTSQIDTVFTGEKPQDSLVENSLSDTIAKENNFDGFTYVAPNNMGTSRSTSLLIFSFQKVLPPKRLVALFLCKYSIQMY